MASEDLKTRTKEFAVRVIRLCRSMPKTEESALIRKQLFRCGTSVGANYRACCRGRSKPDFISKLGIALEEADEALYWMELVVATEVMPAQLLEPLMAEANELVSIFVASLNTAKS
jgi:four helix bundle protein